MATKVEELLNKVRIKLRLADKYDHLSHITSSRPARKTFSNRSNRFRRQAVEIQRAADQAKQA
jgi:hypothetical protein